MSEKRLRTGLSRAAFVLENAADELTVELSSYMEKDVPTEYRPIIRGMRAAAKSARKAALPLLDRRKTAALDRMAHLAMHGDESDVPEVDRLAAEVGEEKS